MSRSDVSSCENKQLRIIPSVVSRVRSQSPQNGCVTAAITPICPLTGPDAVAPVTSHSWAGAAPRGTLAGDYFDFAQHGDALRVTLADAMGKGTGPALVAATGDSEALGIMPDGWADASQWAGAVIFALIIVLVYRWSQRRVQVNA